MPQETNELQGGFYWIRGLRKGARIYTDDTKWEVAEWDTYEKFFLLVGTDHECFELAEVELGPYLGTRPAGERYARD